MTHSRSLQVEPDCLRLLRSGFLNRLCRFGLFRDFRRFGRFARFSRLCRFLGFQLHLVVTLPFVDPGLHLVGLLEAIHKGVLAWAVACAVQTPLSMRLFAPKVGTSLADPWGYAAAAEAEFALAYREAAHFFVEKHVAAGT